MDDVKHLLENVELELDHLATLELDHLQVFLVEYVLDELEHLLVPVWLSRRGLRAVSFWLLHFLVEHFVALCETSDAPPSSGWLLYGPYRTQCTAASTAKMPTDTTYVCGRHDKIHHVACTYGVFAVHVACQIFG